MSNEYVAYIFEENSKLTQKQIKNILTPSIIHTIIFIHVDNPLD